MSEVQPGISSFVLASPFGDEDLVLLPEVKAMGYELIEICVEDPAVLSAAAVRRALEETGLSVSIGGAFGETRDISHDDEAGRRAGVRYLLDLVQLAAGVGSPRVSGPMYSAVGKARMLSDEERARQRGWAVDGIREVADHAALLGIELAIEPLNRFETDLVNTVEQGIELCDLIGRENVGLTLDTFHMNIEEKDIGAAIRAAGPRLMHFQVSENDRGAPGSGHFPWKEAAVALRDISYEGAIVLETFLPNVIEIAKAVSQWRPVAPSMDDLARDSVSFIRREFSRS